tara:strand:+ start:589 stop:768 length:180 start_codon:yes stop_codon:yes gene_type:complete
MNKPNTLLGTLKQTAFALETVINLQGNALGEVAVKELGLYLAGAKRAIERAESERELID